MIHSFDFWVFDFSEKILFLFVKGVAGVSDLPFSSSIFQIQSFVTSVVFGVSLCGFLLWNKQILLYPTDIFFRFLGV